jgi:Zn-dependent protease
MPDQDPQLVILRLLVLFGSISLHEFGHAKSADAAGDPTPAAYGRVTLNPIAHFDPVGATMIVMSSIAGFGIGWGRPVPVNPSKMQNPRWDGFMSVLWGPLTNLIIAVVCALLFRVVPHTPGDIAVVTSQGVATVGFFSGLLFYGTILNLGLALFNLLPIGPLDGHWLLGYLLPQPLGAKFVLWSRTQGMMVLVAIILLDAFAFKTGPGILGTILWPPMQFLARLLLP